jgi:RsmE family RNA methyltransferase
MASLVVPEHGESGTAMPSISRVDFDCCLGIAYLAGTVREQVAMDQALLGLGDVQMNLVLLRDEDWIDLDRVVLRDHRADHLRSLLKLQLGDAVRVGRLGGLRGEGVVREMGADGVQLEVQLHQAPPPRHRFDVVLALPRPKMLRRILRTVAEFGVANLHLINTARVEKSYWQSPLLRPAKLQEALQAGMERASDTIAPQLHLHKRFRPFVEDQLVDLCAGRHCWMAHMDAPRSLADVPPETAVVMIGPEGGFVPFEVELAERVIAKRVHLGARVLSVDTALPAALAQAL